MPFVTDEIDYLSADAEDNFIIAQANAQLNERASSPSTRISARHHQKFLFTSPDADRLHGHCAAARSWASAPR